MFFVEPRKPFSWRLAVCVASSGLLKGLGRARAQVRRGRGRRWCWYCRSRSHPWPPYAAPCSSSTSSPWPAGAGVQPMAVGGTRLVDSGVVERVELGGGVERRGRGRGACRRGHVEERQPELLVGPTLPRTLSVGDGPPLGGSVPSGSLQSARARYSCRMWSSWSRAAAMAGGFGCSTAVVCWQVDNVHDEYMMEKWFCG